MLGGRRLTSRLAPRAGRLQMATGAMMVVVAVAMLADLDIRFQTAIADDLPAVLVNPSKELEESGSVRDQLASIRGDRAHSTIRVHESTEGSKLPKLGAAPDFTGNQMWFNTPDGRKLSLRDLRGKVVLVDFWTYTCINCIRTLPYLKAWDARYRDEGLVIVGVHTPEFPFERSSGNVADAIGQNGIRYAVAQDNDYATWNAYGNQYWPAKYLIDAKGQVRYLHFGEGAYDKTESAIRRLLAEAGRAPGARARASGERPSKLISTPESYLGAERADRFVNGPIQAGTRTFELSGREDAAGHARVRRHLADRARLGHGGQGLPPRAGVRGPAGVPRARLARGRAAAGAREPRWQTAPQPAGGRRRARRAGGDTAAAALPARGPRRARQAPPDARLRARRLRLRFHVRMSVRFSLPREPATA